MGYLIIDTRHADGQVREYETAMCRHCQKVMKIMKNQASGYLCMPCGGPVCDGCATLGMCEPSKRKYQHFMARVEASVASWEFFRRLHGG